MWSQSEFQDAKRPDRFAPNENITDPQPWTKVNISFPLDESQKRALLFWTKMFVDHMVILHMNLVPCTDVCSSIEPEILQISLSAKEEIKSLAQPFQQLQETTLKLAFQWKQFHLDLQHRNFTRSDIDTEGLRLLWNRTYNCKHYVRNIIEQGNTIANIDKSIIYGMLFELYYLRARLENTIEKWKEAAIFMDDIGLHLALAAQYLDSGIFSEKHRAIIRKLLTLSEESFDIRNQFIVSKHLTPELLSKCIRFSIIEHEFFAFQASQSQGKLDSKMHPLLIAHSLEESVFEKDRLQELLTLMSVSPPPAT